MVGSIRSREAAATLTGGGEGWIATRSATRAAATSRSAAHPHPDASLEPRPPMIVELIAIYARIILVSLPLFVAIFFFTWWMRGRGFGELVAVLPRIPFRRGGSRPSPEGRDQGGTRSSDLKR